MLDVRQEWVLVESDGEAIQKIEGDKPNVGVMSK